VIPQKYHGDLSRRDFLKLSAVSLAFLPSRLLPKVKVVEDLPFRVKLGRVAVPVINIYAEPSFDSLRIGRRYRDDLIAIYEEIHSKDGPDYNPIWYRIVNGYAHSGRVQRVDWRPPNQVLESIPEGGILGEVTLPFTTTYRYTRLNGWQPLYRLYYSSLHWITGIEEGPDQPDCGGWYRLKDYLLNVDYHVPAHHLRPVIPQEYNPISLDVPADEKRLVVSISNQTLTAYEGSKVVLTTQVSSGLPSENQQDEEIPTETPLGSFRIQLKMPSRHMGDGKLTSDPQAYELPGVPWTSIFHETGVAFHGTYWHNNFGRRMSHGCVNLRTSDALWLFRWTEPVFRGETYFAKGTGTLVILAE
jgi:hypothetical protein